MIKLIVGIPIALCMFVVITPVALYQGCKAVLQSLKDSYVE
jgi:hypothetical protein